MKKKKTYYVTFARQGYEQLIVKVKAQDRKKAEAKALKVWAMDVDAYVDTEKPIDPECLVVDEEGYEVDLDEEEED